MTASAVPGFARVGFAEKPSWQWSLAADAGYANTEPIGDVGAMHHREFGSLALGYAATDWLLAFGRVEGHLDQHSLGGERESAAEGLPSVGARVHSASAGVRYGGDLELHMPGGKAPSVDLQAITPELRLLAGFASGRAFVFAGSAGFRLERSEHAAPNPSTLSAGDRVALTASEYDAVPLGIAVGARLEPVLLFLEGSAEVLVGADLRTSPMRITLGARHSLTRNWHLEARAGAGLSGRPDDPFGSELLPFEPRFSAALGLRYGFGGDAGSAPQQHPREEPTSRERDQKPAARDAVKVLAHVPSTVSGVVHDPEGQPLPDVNVTLRAGGVEQKAVTDRDGRFAFEGVPEGAAVLEFETVDYELSKLNVVVPGDGAPVSVPVTTMKLAVLGAQIQGLVQTFDGKPLIATIAVSPPGSEHESGPDGRFSIDVPPGRYQVQISKPGYVTQTKEVVVAEKAVIVINVDLRKSR
jgi:hypothetical protein